MHLALMGECDYSMFVKDEAIMVDIDSGRSYDVDGLSSSSPTAAGLNISDAVDTPPFLRKTFQMVEDKETDGIICWSFSRKSFIVLDPFLFSRDLLPTYFKHNNFSSFIRQLNTYGFKKVDSDRWEFANEGFQGGKKQLLRNIKRRKQPQQQQFLEIRETDDQFIKELKKDQTELKMEILKMKEQLERTNTNLANVEDRIQNCQCKQHKMFLFMAKAFASPLFLRQIIHHLRQKTRRHLADDSQITGKKRKLMDQEEQELENMEQEMKILSYDSMDIGGELGSNSSSPDNSTEYILWEKLLEDDMIICENKEEKEEAHNNIVRELEDLIIQPTGF